MTKSERRDVHIGFIGLGTMGSRIAARLCRAGHPIVVNSRRQESAESLLRVGAQWAATPKEVALESNVVFAALPDPVRTKEVALGADGILAGLKPGSAFFDLSTNSPSEVRCIHSAFQSRGAHMLDAPVSGGPRGAESGKLSIWVGGDKTVFDRHEALLREIADQPMYVGPIGSGSIAKLVHNCTQYAFNCVAAEVFTLGVKAGLDPLNLFQAVRAGTLGRRRTFDGLVDQFLPGVFDPPNFALKLALKDVSLATELARQLGVPMKMANLALAEMTEAVNRGWGERDSRVAMLLQEERSGVDIAVDREALKQVLAKSP